MKHLRETFTDEEFKALLEAKMSYPLPINWHDFILKLKALPQLAQFLKDNEPDIADSFEGWGEWKELFNLVFEREAKGE